MTLSHIPFNKPYMTGKELLYIQQAYDNMKLAGDGPYTQSCNRWIEQRTGCTKSLLTHSCTAALEMSAMLADIHPGDEVIMPSYTFASAANAFVLRGGVPVFVDIRTDTLNIDESLIEAAITEKTKAIVAVHYSGIACEMDAIMDIANRYKLLVIEDAAQAVLANYKGKALGSIGHLGCFSFHETKNIISGEGGALLINAPHLVDRAEVIREKGTDRSRFFRGQVDKYTWVDIGSSYLPGEITAAFLWAQMQEADAITVRRIDIWNRYHASFELLEKSGRLRRPVVPVDFSHNAHMYYLLLRDLAERTEFIGAMSRHNINCVFHYIPLHSSPAGQRYGRAHGGLEKTNLQSERLVRLPMFFELSEAQQERVVEAVRKCLA